MGCMKDEIQFRWLILWNGRWRTTRYHCTEEQIRIEHPEAVPAAGTQRVLHVPETEDEYRAIHGRGHGADVGRPGI